ncbi:MAG: HAMP domain-containing sensor histidine kinase, partial [Lachnospiraceae bacterium]|nr:HAMP domain-containing sensor histidine kinase [Lachnospiraceae bacterium]
SSSLGIELFYSAVRLDNGDIIRISKPVKTAFSTALTFLPVMIIIGLVMIFAAYLLSRREAKRLVDPINKINLDEPLKNKTYPELTPLLYRIEKQNKAKEELADMRREFSANVSHELKTPLTSISGYAEIMRDGLVKPEDITEFSSRIYNEANRLLVLINDIIRLSELDEGKVELEKENVDLFDLSKDIVTRLSEKARKNDIKLSLSGTHCTVYGIHRILDEMIYNITDNAIKYNNKGGNVSIWSGSTPEGIYVIVEDDGIGIPEEEQEHIFERFYRVDKSRSKALGGTGLGLSIVKHGAKLHNAQIKVNSEPGVGTKMSLIFPNQ